MYVSVYIYIYMGKLKYFTDLEIPEIREIPLLSYLLAWPQCEMAARTFYGTSWPYDHGTSDFLRFILRRTASLAMLVVQGMTGESIKRAAQDWNRASISKRPPGTSMFLARGWLTWIYRKNSSVASYTNQKTRNKNAFPGSERKYVPSFTKRNGPNRHELRAGVALPLPHALPFADDIGCCFLLLFT